MLTAERGVFMDFKVIISRLRSVADPAAVRGMARYGINPGKALGVHIPDLRKIAREAGRSRRLAGQLWASGIHEARILAGMVDEPGKVTGHQMELWASAFDSWDICDQVCLNLFSKTPLAYDKAVEWSSRDEEFVKRAGFTLMACLAVGDKGAPDARFTRFFPLIRNGSSDRRNYVKKAVNWALRQIGKRNLALNALAAKEAEAVHALPYASARWIASGALRELRSPEVLKRLKLKEKKHSEKRVRGAKSSRVEKN
jgi:3-methyladenine DNA glycosylase AlkD